MPGIQDTIMGVGRGYQGGLDPWILKLLANKGCFLISRDKNRNSPFLAPLEKNLGKSPTGPSLEKILPTPMVTMRFYFMLGLALVISDCGITAECGVKKSGNTSAAHICAFCETKSLCKKAKCDAYGLFCGIINHNR